MIIGDGYLPYHIRVYVNASTSSDFGQYVKAATSLKHEFEQNTPGGLCHEMVVERLRQITPAAQVYPFGGYSAVLGALKMIRHFDGAPCGMFGVIGTGPISHAIQDDLAARNIALFPTVRHTADSSLEIAIFDTQFRFFHEFQIQFLPTRDRGHILRLAPGGTEAITGFLCSRPNNGRVAVARRLSEAGRLVSLRVHGFSRFVQGEDYLKIVPYAQQVFVRGEEMRQLGRALGVHFPRQGWQPNGSDVHLNQFVAHLGNYQNKRRVVALAFHRVVFLFVPGLGLVQFQVPPECKNSVSDTRFHGALMVEALRFHDYLPSTKEELVRLGDRALQAAYCGWDDIPPSYPDASFACTNSWEVPSRPLGVLHTLAVQPSFSADCIEVANKGKTVNLEENPMIQFDSQWLEKVWGSRGAKGPYQKIDVEERAVRIRSLFIQYLEMEAWKFMGDPPVDLRIKPMKDFPWVDYTWRGENGGGANHNVPLQNRTYPAVQRFSITLAPKFLRAKEEDLLTLLDFVLYGDAKSIRGLIDAFAPPRFQSHPERLAATPNSGSFLNDGLPLRKTSPARGRVYDLETIRTKVEKEFFKFTTGVKIMWAESVSFSAAGRYIPEVRYILINPALDYPDVPYVVVEHLVHHELLHDLIPRKGRSAHHKTFREAERQYPHYQEAKAWMIDNYSLMMSRAERREGP